MLSPNTRIVLLPQDREIMDITGMSEEQYRWFVKQAIIHSKLRPGEPVAFLSIVASLVIGVALSVAGSLLAPKPRQQQQQAREQRQIGGQDFVSGQRFGPTSGFDSVQNVVELGSTIPLVYAKRQRIGNSNYGGVRVNTNLLWSQLFSLGGGQLLRAIFLISEGTIGQPDPRQFAIGNNLLSTFDLEQSDTSRLSIYFTDGSNERNRIISTDAIAGRPPATDPGNLNPSNVFAARGKGDELNDDFVFASTPSNQTTFGVGTFIGNALSYRVNPNIQPAKNPRQIGRETDDQRTAERKKDDARFQARAAIINLTKGDGNTGFVAGPYVAFEEGDTFTYKIFNQSDFDGNFRSGSGKVDTKDVAQSVASRQNSYDDAIQLGDRYLAGTATAVCINREEKAFNSEVAFNPVKGGNSVEATFKVIKSGFCNIYKESEINQPLRNEGDEGQQPATGPQVNATRFGHIMRVAEGFISTERKTKFVEVGFRSVVNLQLNGICAWQNVDKSYDTIDTLNEAESSFYTNPTFTAPETRYSFFKIRYKKAMGSLFTDVNCIFAIRSLSSSPVFNYLRFEFPSEDLWEIQFIPVSGFEARQKFTQEIIEEILNNFASYQGGSLQVGPNRDQIENNDDVFYKDDTENHNGFGDDANFYVKESDIDLNISIKPINVLDYKNNNRLETTLDGITFRYSGEENIPLTTDTFGIQILSEGIKGDGDGVGPLNGFDDNGINNEGDNKDYHADAFARMAEKLIYDEFSTTSENPEHQIVYVNTQTSNVLSNGQPFAPTYGNLALIGLNIRSSTEISQLQQFSVYVENGIQVDGQSTSDFPKVLLDLLTNQRYGTGSILNSKQIDQDSFDAAAEFCRDRLYFFDGIIDEKLNIRSWAAQTAQAFLLDFVIRNGKFALQPAVNLDGPETIRGLFTAGNIIEDTFELSFADEQDRIPPRVQVRWREEKPDQDKGLFPLIRQVTVREAGTPEDAPLEQIDASAFATSQKHAIDVAKFICRTKRLVTHSVSFTTTPTENVLDIGSVFKLGLETVNFEQPQNGAITSTNEVTSWPPLADGSYPVLLWDGSSLRETTLTVVNGKAAPSNSVFCLRNTTATTQTYKAQSLSFNEDGNIEVQATFFPTDDRGISLIAKDFDSTDPNDWIIEGAI